MPCYWNGCRYKAIHSVGTVSKVKFISFGNSPYTGIFGGADYGLIRLSAAIQPDFKSSPADGTQVL